MEGIKDTVEKIMQDWSNLKERFIGQPPELLLKRLFNKKELEHVKFNFFKNGILGIGVDSSVWLYQLNLKKEFLLNKLRKQLPTVKDIHFSLWQGG